MFDVNAEKKLDDAREILRDKLTFCYGDGKGGWASLGYGLQRVADLAVYECAKKYIAAYEENYFDKDFVEELAKQPIQAMPLPKPKTAVDFELEISGWTVEQVSEVAKKIREECGDKCNLHIKFVGSVLMREYS